MRKISFVITALLLVAIFAFLAEHFAPAEEVKLDPISPAPTSISSFFEIKEDTYIVNFFASWCGPCKDELENMDIIKKKYNLPIYGIAVKDTLSNANSMIGTNSPYKNITADFPENELMNLSLQKIPRIFIIYKNNVIYDHQGEVNSKILEKKIIPILKKIEQEKGATRD